MGKFSVQNIKKSAARASKSTDELKLVPKLEYVRCDKIEFHPNNRFADDDNEQDISDIADDIAVNGIMHTIVVNKRGEKYRILSGEKRFRAARLLKKETVPCNVYDNLDDATEMRILYSANLQVRTYSPARILQLYRELNDMLNKQKNEGRYSGSITSGIAKIMRISERQVRKYSRICDELDSEHLKFLRENKISINDADKILKHEKTELVPLSPARHKKTELVPLSTTAHEKTEPVPLSTATHEKTEPVPLSTVAHEKTEPVPLSTTAHEKTEPVPLSTVAHEKTEPVPKKFELSVSVTNGENDYDVKFAKDGVQVIKSGTILAEIKLASVAAAIVTEILYGR